MASLAEITQNRQKIIAELNVRQLLVLKQIHGTIVLDADNLDDFGDTPPADAAITTKRGIALSIQTADCVPVLFATTDGTTIGSAHCGWRGAKEGIIANTVNMIHQKSAAEIVAVIGPAIHQQSYEVDCEFYRLFLNENIGFQRFFTPVARHDHYLFNLPAFVQHKLEKAGVQKIEVINEDTYSNLEKYPSYRRFAHQDNGKYQGPNGIRLTPKEKMARILSTVVLR